MQFIYFIKLVMQYFNDKVLNNALVEILKIQVYEIIKFTLCQNSCSGYIFTFSSFFGHFCPYLCKRCRAGSGLPHGRFLFSSIGSGSSISKAASDLAVLGQVEGSDLLCLLNLLLVGLDLALELVNEALHALVVLLVLISSEGELLDGSLSLAEVLEDIGVASALGIKFRLQLTDAGLHLDHGLSASLEGIDLSLISTGSSVLALGLKKLLVLLKGHGKLLLASEFISKTSSINHCSGRLLLGQSGLVGHLIQVALELVVLRLQLPEGGGNGLVDIGQISEVLVGVSQLLLSSTSLSVSGLKKSAGLLEAVLHGGGLTVSLDLLVGSGGLGLGLSVNLDLGVSDLELVLLDGGLGLGVAGDGVLKSEAEVSGISLQLLLHSESLSLALGLGLEGGLHGVKSLGLVLADHGELLVLLGNSALNLGLDLGELHLASQDLVLLLLKGGLGFLKSGLELHLLSFEPLADFVNLVDGASSLGDLVHDVLDLIGQGLVLASHLLKLENSLLVGRLDLKKLRRGISGLLLADIKIEGQAVNLALHLGDGLVELLGLPLHGGVDNLGLVEVGGHLGDLSLDLALGLLNLGELGVEVVNGSLSLGVPGGQLHLGHLQFLSLGNSLLLVLLSHGSSISLGLGIESEDVLTSRGFLIKSLLGNIDLMLQVSVLAQQKLSLSGLIVAQSLDVIELCSKGSLGLGEHVEVVLKISNNAEKFSILVGNLVLGHTKVSKSEVGSINLLVDGIELVNKVLVGLVGRGLASGNLLGGSSGISDLHHDDLLVLLDLGLHLLEGINLLLHLKNSITLLPLQVAEDRLAGNVGLLNILAELDNLSFTLLVELNLGNGGTTGLIV